MGSTGQIMKTRIMSAMKCTKSPTTPQHDDNSDNSDKGDGKIHRKYQPANKIFGIAKMGLMLLMVFGGLSRLGRRRRRNISNMSSSSYSSPYMSMNDMYNSTLGNLSQATVVALPAHISSHLSDISLTSYHYENNDISNNNNYSSTNDTNNTKKNATPYFWDVHFSGESVAEYIFSACHGLIQACELGIRQPDFTEDVSI